MYEEIFHFASQSVVVIESLSEAKELSGGSGFLFDQDGHIVTNAHVIENAEKIVVRFRDGLIVTAKQVGIDRWSDLAVIKVDVTSNLPRPIPFGDSENLVVGQRTLAIGNPHGQHWSMTQGIISGLDRLMDRPDDLPLPSVIQTDAALNPGNSGGPLINLKGELIGVNTFTFSNENNQVDNLGFAIPSNLTRHVTEALLATGHTTHNYIGLTGTDIDLIMKDDVGLPNEVHGVLVRDVIECSPAERSGLRPYSVEFDEADSGHFTRSYDVITEIDYSPIIGLADLSRYLTLEATPGQTMTLTIIRNTIIVEELLLPIMASSFPYTSSVYVDGKQNKSHSFIGISGVELDATFINDRGLPVKSGNVLVSEVVDGSPACYGNLREYSIETWSRQQLQNIGEPDYGQDTDEKIDIITAIDGIDVGGMDDLNRYMAQNTRSGQIVTLTICRAEYLRYVMRISLTLDQH